MTAIRVHELVPMLMCRDTQASVAFYTEVLGFEVRDRMDDVGRSGWASLRRGGTTIMLASPTYIPAGVRVDGRFPQSLYYIYVSDAAALRASIVAKGVVASELTERFYGMKEFEIVDPEGHVLVFGEDMDEGSTDQ